MTQEEKELIYKDLCGRLLYGVIVQQSAKYPKGHSMYNVADKWDTEPHDFKIIGVEGTNTLITDKRKEERTYAKGIVSSPITICIYNGLTKQVSIPYLRPMSSMTEEEKNDLFQLMGRGTDIERIDFYISHHFDYRGLIPMGLALEAPKDMYQ